MDANMDTISIEDLPDNPDEIIDLEEDNSDDVLEVTNIQDLRTSGRYDDIYKENKLFFNLIDKCLEIQPNDGMQRVINKSLIPAFERTTKEFRQSEEFSKIVTKALCDLEQKPYFKFTYIKEVCEKLKLMKFPLRKFKIIDLTKSPGKIKKLTKLKIKLNKSKPKAILELSTADQSDCFEVPLIALEEFVNIDEQSTVESVIPKDDFEKRQHKKITKASQGKENCTVVKLTENPSQSHNAETDVTTVPVYISDDEVMEVADLGKPSDPAILNENQLLIPRQEEELKCDENILKKKIHVIETQIAAYNSLVAKWELEEVTDYSESSQYVQCERYKAMIVQLHQQLCELTGEEPVKRREVRLVAAEERLKPAMAKLEEFINNNIQSDGFPHFPDFCDVVRCVREANDYRQGLNNPQVMSDARTLFTYCGRALQKSRQRREWRDMLSLVKSDLVQDPADADPELKAKLEANRRLAVARETEVFDRYTQMENQYNIVNNNTTITLQPQSINRVRLKPTTITPTLKTPVIRIRKNQMVKLVTFKDMTQNNSKDIASEENQSLTALSNTCKDISNPQSSIAEFNKLSKCNAPLMFDTSCSSNDMSIQEINLSGSDCSFPMNTGFDHGEHEPSQTLNSTETQGEKHQMTSTSNTAKETKMIEHVCGDERNVETNNTPCLSTQLADIVEPPDDIKTELDQVNNTGSNDILAHFLQASLIGTPFSNVPSHTDDSIDKIPLATHTDDSIDIISLVTSNENEMNKSKNGELTSETNIKEEPCIDIQKELDELGTDFTTSIIDIEDPFLVVEISSDGSSDDDDVEEVLRENENL